MKNAKVYSVGVSSNEEADMDKVIGRSYGTVLFSYLAHHVGTNMNHAKELDTMVNKLK